MAGVGPASTIDPQGRHSPAEATRVRAPPRLAGFFSIPGSPGLQRGLRAVALLTLAANVAYLFSILAVERPANGYTTFWDGWVYHIATTAPAVLTAFRATINRFERLQWSLVSLGIVANTLGNLVYTFHDQNLDPVPFPAWSDVPYLGSYVLFSAALLIISQRHVRGTSRSVRIDGLIVGLSIGAASVALWFDSILEQSGSIVTVAVGLSYPLFDLVFIVVIIAGLAPARFRPSWSSATFIGGVVAFAVGDVVFLRQVAVDEYSPGTLLEWTWLLGIMAFGLAAWVPSSSSRRPEPGQADRASVLPGLAAFVSLAVVIPAQDGQTPPLAFWMAIASIAGVVARLAFAVRDLQLANDSFRLARTDDLTGLMNRRGFNERLDRTLAGSDFQHCTTLIVDLNGFKEVNDSLGHHAGDMLLQIVARRFERVIPSGGFVGRLGGDEFGAVIPGSSDDGLVVAVALNKKLDDPVSIDGVIIRVSAAIGMAHSDEQGKDRGELMRSADVAMYAAKSRHSGHAWYIPGDDPHSRERLSMIEDLRSAIEERAFDLHYQPRFDVHSGGILGLEALIRWNHPTRGPLLPDQFIPLAERVGLIPAITRAVLDSGIAYIASVRAKGHVVTLSVNISAKDLVDEELASYVGATLAAHRVDPSVLTLEITETAVALDPVRAKRTLLQLRETGVRVSIDDFGVGYSSMSQLLELPLDELKIDRTFLLELATDARAQAILSATVELGRSLGLNVVAEGVETKEVLAELTRRGVESAQGFLFSPALPVDELEKLLSASTGDSTTSRT